MADQSVEEQNVDNDAVEPGKGGDVVDVVKDGQAAGDDHAGDVSVKEESSSGTDWKAEARKWESRAKSNFAELEKLRASDGDAGSVIDDLRRKNEELEDRINGFVLEGVKREVASEYGLSSDAIAFLSGGDKESLAESAKALKGSTIVVVARVCAVLRGVPPLMMLNDVRVSRLWMLLSIILGDDL
ncbi:capsid and scaffold protein [Propionibacterium phage pa28]|nr:capsid and scaffold protein [Propionibacterium phage pa28]